MSNYFYYVLMAVVPVLFLTGCLCKKECKKSCGSSCEKTCIKSKAVVLETNDQFQEKAKHAVDKIHEVVEDTILDK